MDLLQPEYIKNIGETEVKKLRRAATPKRFFELIGFDGKPSDYYIGDSTVHFIADRPLEMGQVWRCNWKDMEYYYIVVTPMDEDGSQGTKERFAFCYGVNKQY